MPYLNFEQLEEGNLYKVVRDPDNCFEQDQIFFLIKKSLVVEGDFQIWIVLIGQGITEFLFDGSTRFKLLGG